MISKLEKVVNKSKELIKEGKKFIGIGLLASTIALASPSKVSSADASIFYGKLQSKGYNSASVKQKEFQDYLKKDILTGFSIKGSVSYINEGHLDDPDMHHRDGFIAQVWGDYSPKIIPKLNLSAGVGPYYYYDTQLESKYVRDFAIVSSLNAKYNLPYGLNIQGRVNFIDPIINKNVSTQSVLLGVGIDLSSKNKISDYLLRDNVKYDEKGSFCGDGKNQISFGIDQHFKEGIKDTVKAVEYRRIFTKNLEGSVSYLFKDEPYGAAAQGWLVKNIKNIKFGIGTGVYFDWLSKTEPEGSNKDIFSHIEANKHNFSQVVSTIVSYQITKELNIQTECYRIHPNLNKDEDIRLRLNAGVTF